MSKRKSRAMDPDLRWLKAADKALRTTSPRMRRATLEFLLDKYFIHAAKTEARERLWGGVTTERRAR